MTPRDSHDVRADRLDRLQRLAPDADRAERVRVRCRTRLERSRRRVASTDVSGGRARRLLGPVVVGGVCAFYVVALLEATLRLQGILR